MQTIQIDDIELIKIDPNQFLMGALKDDKFANNLEVNRLINITNSYYLQSTPVTVSQYMKFIRETGYEHDYFVEVWDMDKDELVPGPSFLEINGRGDNYPIIGVSYIDSQKYIDWLSAKYKMKFDLPSEAQFENAAKDKCDCLTFCRKSEELRKAGLVRKVNEIPLTAPREVKKGTVTKSGIYDLHGLIWQWCKDWFYYYDMGDIVNPVGPPNCPEFAPWKGEKWSPGRVIRGGSFAYPFYHSRCSNRHYSQVQDRNFNVGFRLCINE
ncbi:formylglycine-generating enzyme family protein [Paenibacillus macerans]|uniref:Sulfatase-modifying factor enzyme 1 family protein n=1 Tax=Paenibacillus macerans TaxID=44252 RepID=A0A090ZKX8_PAEMA|nr:formylglycine-generating enzyme family protein [Paenibacillus macerans]KFN11277.1 sulfatase-modifying factor enzyme 1 family protein [Paenibacillus macerans]MCY7560215.1 formylglycine-generating enzyme family protein [Paenibacillus macerans]MEC0151269.1 formylglycine-generating enzyme family protein [Paenibacillus macerans]SUD26828.1 non-specific serine/threonine protein kinase [Paenibacillus macerans]